MNQGSTVALQPVHHFQSPPTGGSRVTFCSGRVVCQKAGQEQFRRDWSSLVGPVDFDEFNMSRPRSAKTLHFDQVALAWLPIASNRPDLNLWMLLHRGQPFAIMV